MVTEGKKDVVPAVAMVVGAAGVGAGLYFFLKKPSGIDQGDTLMASFKFDYAVPGGPYILQVSLGRVLPLGIFDHVEGLTRTLDIVLPESPREWEFLVLLPLPEATAPKSYDGEATIRRRGMDWLDYLVKVTAKNVITVREQ